MVKSIWKTILIVALILVILGGVIIGVGMMTGADSGRVQDLFYSTYNVSSFNEYYTGIIHNLLGLQPLN